MHTLKGSRFFFPACCPLGWCSFLRVRRPLASRGGAPWEEDTFLSKHTRTVRKRPNLPHDRCGPTSASLSEKMTVEMKSGKRKKWGYNKNCSSPSFLRRLVHSSCFCVCVRLGRASGVGGTERSGATKGCPEKFSFLAFLFQVPRWVRCCCCWVASGSTESKKGSPGEKPKLPLAVSPLSDSLFSRTESSLGI